VDRCTMADESLKDFLHGIENRCYARPCGPALLRRSDYIRDRACRRHRTGRRADRPKAARDGLHRPNGYPRRERNSSGRSHERRSIGLLSMALSAAPNSTSAAISSACPNALPSIT
jgi:hypothetical protein